MCYLGLKIPNVYNLYVQNNNDFKGDFASLAKSIPTMIQFEYINLGEAKNSVLVGTD